MRFIFGLLSLPLVCLFAGLGLAQTSNQIPTPDLEPASSINQALPPIPEVMEPGKGTSAQPRPAVSKIQDQSLKAKATGMSALVSEVEGLFEPFIYDSKGQRDPFRPFSEAKIAEDADDQVPLLPLQRFELDQLKLIGIIWDVVEPKAMFLDPNAEVYTIGKDERIGRHSGYIATIREGEVVVVEASRVRGEVVYTSRIVRIAR